MIFNEHKFIELIKISGSKTFRKVLFTLAENRKMRYTELGMKALNLSEMHFTTGKFGFYVKKLVRENLAEKRKEGNAVYYKITDKGKLLVKLLMQFETKCMQLEMSDLDENGKIPNKLLINYHKNRF